MVMELDLVHNEKKSNFSNRQVANKNQIKDSPHTSCGLPFQKVTSNWNEVC